MHLYECVFIARSDMTQQQVDAAVDQVIALIEGDGGSIKKREYWGLRTLAYRIKKNRKGHYTLLGMEASPASVQEMERRLSLNEDILRFLTVRVEVIEDAPSPIMSRRSDDRDKGERDDDKVASSSKAQKSIGRFESGRRRNDERGGYKSQSEDNGEQEPASVAGGGVS